MLKPPTGSVAFVLVGSGTKRVDLDQKWKREEIQNILTRLAIPNNFRDF